VTDLSFMYRCAECNRNFATPARLKNHQNLCREGDSAKDLDPVLSQLASNDTVGRPTEPGLPTSDWVPERTSKE
jgi:hypothetical protein